MNDESFNSPDKAPYSPLAKVTAAAAANSSSQKTSGMTQAIRQKLNFTDESLWKKFSARRLELIDSMALSEKKASEQDDDITGVADKLRSEYGYHQDTLPDFERLVRAGIQSVRRNRKRVPKSRGFSHTMVKQKSSTPVAAVYQPSRFFDDDMEDSHSPSEMVSPMDSSSSNKHDDGLLGKSTRSDSEMTDVGDLPTDESSFRGRISISALVSPAPGDQRMYNAMPSPDTHSGGLYPPMKPPPDCSAVPELLASALAQLVSLVDRCEMPPLGQDVAKREYLGHSVLNTAATLSVQSRRFAATDDLHRFVESVLLAPHVLQTVSSVFPASSIFSSEQQHTEHLKLKVAACAVCYGFDDIIRRLSTVFTEMVNADMLPDGHRYDFQGFLPNTTPSNNAPTYYNPHHSRQEPAGLPMMSPSASSSRGTSLSGVSVLPNIIPVTLSFFSQKLDFTYAPGSSTPPTIPEILDNGKNAFHILGDNKVLKIRDLNGGSVGSGGRIIDTDGELAEVFETSRIDLELFFPAFEVSNSSSNNNNLRNNGNNGSNNNSGSGGKYNIGNGGGSNGGGGRSILHNGGQRGEQPGLKFQEVL